MQNLLQKSPKLNNFPTLMLLHFIITKYKHICLCMLNSNLGSKSQCNISSTNDILLNKNTNA